MFVRHATRLVSVVLMVLVSVGFTAGIGMAKDKIGDSLSEYYTAQNVSDIILMNEDGAFSDADVSAISEHYGADNVQTGGMLEFEVRDGKGDRKRYRSHLYQCAGRRCARLSLSL